MENKKEVVLEPLQTNRLELLRLAWLMTFVASVAYVATEWLFLVTKISSISVASAIEKTLILVFGISLFTLLGCLLQTLIFFPFYRKRGENNLYVILLVSIPALILAVTVLLLVDNFTYITMGFGIITSRGGIKALYALTFVLLIAFFIYKMSKIHKRNVKAWSGKRTKANFVILLTLVILMAVTIGSVFYMGIKQKSDSLIGEAKMTNRKNVILITADGLNAEQMSIYGYEKETTPFLKSISSKMLISVNNFSNSGNTTGSISSILTSKQPSSLRVLYRPDILRGKDSYQSLPAILKNMGYYSAQYSFGYYADAFAINFKNAFDYANGRTAKSNNLFALQDWPLPTHYEYFLYDLQTRIVSRLKHIFMIKDMDNEFQQLAQLDTSGIHLADKEKFDNAVNILSHTKQPVFLHLHWMKTHGPTFNPRNRVFSVGFDNQEQGNWNTAFYEDAILDFDEDLKNFYSELKNMDLLDDTVIIIGSDHGSQFVTNRRIPLLMLFPDDDLAGKITIDTQNLDIAPTILDYVGVDIPEWMEGNSLFSKDDSYRPIFGVRTLRSKEIDGKGWGLDDEYNKPPFFQFDIIGVQNCGMWTQLNLEEYTWSQSEISTYESLCDPKDVLDRATIRAIIIERLKKDGFEFNETLIPFFEKE